MVGAESSDRLEALLLDVSRKLDKLLELHAFKKAPTLSEADLACLKVLLPAVYESIGPVVWTVRDLVCRPEPRVVAVLGEIAATPKVLGKLLARADGVPIAGFRVERAKVVREGTLWAVDKV